MGWTGEKFDIDDGGASLATNWTDVADVVDVAAAVVVQFESGFDIVKKIVFTNSICEK